MKTKFYFFLAAMMVLGFILLTCTEEPPTAPGRTNPLDNQNPQTGGDPFNLTAQIAGGGIQLTWNITPLGTVTGYNIHRKVDDGTFELEYQVNGKYTSSFVDTLIQNGHKYYYYIVTRNSQGQESTSNTAEVFIITDPFLQIDDQNGYTPSRVVNLTLLAFGAAKMQVGTPDLSGASWVNYNTSATITLPAGSGTKTVQARFVYTNGDTSAVVSHVTQPTGMNPAFNIEHNAQYASTRQVWLYPIATGSNLKCQFSENNQFTGASWENYADSVNFTLSTGGGTKTVYTKFMNDFEIESSVLSDQITPQPMNPAFNIADSAQYTSTRLVTLYSSATGSNLKAMYSENSAFSGASWQNYSVTSNFTLSTGSGTKTVYAIYKNDFEIESITLEDGIEYILIDQSQTGHNYGFGFELSVIRWQEFFPGLDNLNSVELFIGRSGSAGNVIIQIRSDSTTILGEQIIMEQNVPFNDWVSVEFSTLIYLNPSESYRIYMFSDEPSPLPSDRYFWSGNTSSNYPGINDVYSGWPNYDYAFITYGY